MTLVYFDTCVWISALFKKDINHKKAVSEFEKVRKGIYVVLISNYILSEIFDYLKKITIMNQKNNLDMSKINFEKELKNIYQDFVNKLLSLVNVRIINPNVSTNKIFKPSLNLLYNNVGSIYTEKNCPICATIYDYWGYEGLYKTDVIHTMLAKELNCDLLITFDNDYRILQTESIISPLAIEIL